MKQKNAPAIESLARAGASYRVPAEKVSTAMVSTSRCGCGSRAAATSHGRCASCGGTQRKPLSVRNDEGDCDPAFLAVSCDTQIRLKQCVKTVICDLLWCLEGKICPNGQPDFAQKKQNFWEEVAQDCLGTALCSLVRCVPEALCPPTTQCEPERPCIDVECSYAVEELP
jgi:hypothetical protein